MFDRVDQMVIEEKRARNLKRSRLRAAENRRSAGIELDMNLIAGEMQEESPVPGRTVRIMIRLRVFTVLWNAGWRE